MNLIRYVVKKNTEKKKLQHSNLSNIFYIEDDEENVSSTVEETPARQPVIIADDKLPTLLQAVEQLDNIQFDDYSNIEVEENSILGKRKDKNNYNADRESEYPQKKGKLSQQAEKLYILNGHHVQQSTIKNPDVARLSDAIKRLKPKLVEKYVSSETLWGTNKNGVFLFHVAAKKDCADIRIFTPFLDNDMPVDLPDEADNTPLMLILLHTKERSRISLIELVIYFIGQGANVHATNTSGQSPYSIAIKRQYEEIVDIMKKVSNGDKKEMKSREDIDRILSELPNFREIKEREMEIIRAINGKRWKKAAKLICHYPDVAANAVTEQSNETLLAYALQRGEYLFNKAIQALLELALPAAWIHGALSAVLENSNRHIEEITQLVKALLLKDANLSESQKNEMISLSRSKGYNDLAELFENSDQMNNFLNETSSLSREEIKAKIKALSNALNTGNIPKITATVNEFSVNGTNSRGRPLFSVSNIRTVNNLDLMRVFLQEKKLKINLADKEGNNALANLFNKHSDYYAERANSQNLYAAAELLLKHGADPDQANKEGKTPIMLANQYPKIVALMKEYSKKDKTTMLPVQEHLEKGGSALWKTKETHEKKKSESTLHLITPFQQRSANEK